ncbi:CGNR zinc finger domain-containing protein [Streptomyces sp. NPDC101165]|uniref:CGNR zinc finger domain-containing protein n=1 Tax=Streptomyces sp. NPDC101165 TaxID=3366119 RepID=UPI0037F81666
MKRCLALELASTIRHDGQGGVTDDLSTVDGLAAWIDAQGDLLDLYGAGTGPAPDEAARREVVAVREAVRALFARAVSPAPPSPADAHRLLPADQAVARLNAAASRRGVVPHLDWPDEGPAELRFRPAEPDAPTALAAVLAHAAVDFLAGPERAHLRACTAPRCVRYFLRTHGRQEWCKPSCGNRARAARHYQRHRPAAPDTSGTRT